MAVLNAKLEELRVLEMTLAENKKNLNAQQDHYEYVAIFNKLNNY